MKKRGKFLQVSLPRYILLQHYHLPATMRVRFTDGVEGIVKPLHSTTVPLSQMVAVNLKMEVMFLALFMPGGPTLVRVA